MELSRNLKIRLLTSFLNRTASFAIVPFMTIFFVTQFGLQIAGIIGIIQVIVSYTANIVGGYLGDTYNPHSLIFRGQIAQALTQLLIGISILELTDSRIIIFLYFMNVIISNLYKTTFSSLLIASVNDGNKKKAYMLDYVSVNVSLALGVSIGALLFGKYQFIVFLFSSMIIFIVAMILNTQFDYSHIHQSKKSIKDSTLKNEILSLVNGYKIPIKDKRFVLYVLGTALIMSSPLAIDSLGQVHFNKSFSQETLAMLGMHNGTQLYGLVQIENVIVVVIGTLIFSKFINDVKNKTILLMLIAYVLSYNAIYNTTNIALIILLVFIGSLAELGYASFVQSMQVDLIPQKHRAKYLSFNSLGNYMSQFIGYLALMVLSGSTMLITTFLLAVLSLIGVYIIIRIKISLSNTKVVKT